MNGRRGRLFAGLSVLLLVVGLGLALIALLTWNTFECAPGEIGVLGVSSDGSVSSTCSRQFDSPLLLWLGVASLLGAGALAAAALRSRSRA